MFGSITDTWLGHMRDYKTLVSGQRNFRWYACENLQNSLPNQGWKIHISANLSNAAEILESVLPYLIQHKFTFKHTYTESDLSFLNSGKGGLSQVGKFLTVYCLNEVHLADTLIGLSLLFRKNFSVPFIVSDKRYQQDLPLFYRYGVIKASETQNAMGIFESALVDSDGESNVDIRGTIFSLPNGITDPFVNQGTVNVSTNNKLLLDKYVTFEKLSDTYKTETYFGIDLHRSKSCTIKIAKPDIEIERGIYSKDLLQNETRILRLLQDKAFPEVYEAFEYQDKLVLVTSFKEGINLFDFISLNAIQGIFLSRSQIKKLFTSILCNLQKLEQQGVLHNDLKPNNIIVDGNLNTSFIDFETSQLKHEQAHKQGSIRSRGYYSNKENVLNPDYYSLGVILHFMYTAYNVSDAPREHNIFERPLHYLTGKVNPAIEKYIADLCGNRYHTVDCILTDFKIAIASKTRPFKIASQQIEEIPFSYQKITHNITNWLFENCIVQENLAYWKSTHVFNAGVGRADLNIGSGGILLYISYTLLTNTSLSKEQLAKFEKAIRYLNRIKQENQISGLFVGESGKVLATLLGFVALGKFDLEVIGPSIVYIKENLPSSNDLFNGKAGIGLMFLFLHIITNEKEHLETAIAISNNIIDSSEITKEGICWKDTVTDAPFLGFAHGLAGIGYFLTMLYGCTKETALLGTLNRITDTLLQHAVKTPLQRKNLINWPNEPGKNITNNHWCNGTAGIANYFLNLYRVTQDASYLAILADCKDTIIKSSSFMNPTMCHGLAGNINFLISYYQLTKDKELKIEIFRLAEVLKMEGVILDEHFLFPSESPFVVTPDFWVGFSGTAYVFQRLTDIETNLDFLTAAFYQKISMPKLFKLTEKAQAALALSDLSLPSGIS